MNTEHTGVKVLDIDEDPIVQKPNKDVFHKSDTNDDSAARKTSNANGIEEEEAPHDQATTSGSTAGAPESSGSAQAPGRQGSGER